MKIALALTICVLRAVLLFGVGMAVVAPALLGGELDPGTVRGALVLGLILVLDAGLTVGVGLLLVAKVGLRELGWRFDDALVDVARGVIGFAFCAGAVMLGLFIATGSIPFADVRASIVETPLEMRFLYVGIGVSAAFIEESLYRGYLQPALIARLGLVAGIVVTAILFDVLHLNFRPASLVAKLGIGLVLGVLRGRDRSLLAPAVAHGLVWAVFGFS